MGYVRCIKHALPHMMRQGGGRVVNLIGNDGIKHSYWEIAPGAANAAGQNLTNCRSRASTARHNITFVAGNPGPVRTERWDGLVKGDGARHAAFLRRGHTSSRRAAFPWGASPRRAEVANLVAMPRLAAHAFRQRLATSRSTAASRSR